MVSSETTGRGSENPQKSKSEKWPTFSAKGKGVGCCHHGSGIDNPGGVRRDHPLVDDARVADPGDPGSDPFRRAGRPTRVDVFPAGAGPTRAGGAGTHRRAI